MANTVVIAADDTIPPVGVGVWPENKVFQAAIERGIVRYDDGPTYKKTAVIVPPSRYTCTSTEMDAAHVVHAIPFLWNIQRMCQQFVGAYEVVIAGGAVRDALLYQHGRINYSTGPIIKDVDVFLLNFPVENTTALGDVADKFTSAVKDHDHILFSQQDHKYPSKGKNRVVGQFAPVDKVSPFVGPPEHPWEYQRLEPVLHRGVSPYRQFWGFDLFRINREFFPEICNPEFAPPIQIIASPHRDLASLLDQFEYSICQMGISKDGFMMLDTDCLSRRELMMTQCFDPFWTMQRGFYLERKTGFKMSKNTVLQLSSVMTLYPELDS